MTELHKFPSFIEEMKDSGIDTDALIERIKNSDSVEELIEVTRTRFTINLDNVERLTAASVFMLVVSQLLSTILYIGDDVGSVHLSLSKLRDLILHYHSDINAVTFDKDRVMGNVEKLFRLVYNVPVKSKR